MCCKDDFFLNATIHWYFQKQSCRLADTGGRVHCAATQQRRLQPYRKKEVQLLQQLHYNDKNTV